MLLSLQTNPGINFLYEHERFPQLNQLIEST